MLTTARNGETRARSSSVDFGSDPNGSFGFLIKVVFDSHVFVNSLGLGGCFGGFAGFATNNFTRVTNTFTLVRFGGPDGTNISG